MRIAIISDIHANLEALRKALKIIDTKNVDHLYCLGDVVGYGADPNECIALLRERGVSCIIGNHDKAVLNPDAAADLNRFARQAIEWTARQLTAEHLEFLAQLPYIIVEHNCTCMLRRINPKNGTTLSPHMTRRKISNSSQLRYAGSGTLIEAGCIAKT